MLGGMQDYDFKVTHLIDHAAREHGDREHITRWADGSETRTDWAGVRRDAKKMSQALQALGLGKGDKIALTPLPPAVGRAIDRAVGDRETGPILLSRVGTRMDRHAATRRLRSLADQAGVQLPRMHPHMLRHTYVTTMLDAGVPLRDAQIAARHADPRTTMRYDRARKNLDRHPNYILAAFMASGT